ncbi:MAG TPA: hypothetical protein PLM18_07530, partial [Sedimentibacter sp.]|nr:hypothetical protein [Sedimentibacter sp.]
GGGLDRISRAQPGKNGVWEKWGLSLFFSEGIFPCPMEVEEIFSILVASEYLSSCIPPGGNMIESAGYSIWRRRAMRRGIIDNSRPDPIVFALTTGCPKHPSLWRYKNN